MANLKEIEGIGPVYAGKLEDIGIKTTEALLEKGAAPGGRKEIADKCDISPKLILRWVNMADLFRIKGIGEEYSDLLEASGVDTVPELAQRNPENLYEKMAEVNEEKNLVRHLPGKQMVADWVAEAKTLPRVLTY